MFRNTRIVLLATVTASFFITGSALAANELNVYLNTAGTGKGQVTLSATSSGEFEFHGWSGESCIGKGKCGLRDLKRGISKKKVTAAFGAPTCTEFIYSGFGACQLDGTSRRTVITALPPGCEGGSPIISTSCFYNPCAFGTTFQGSVGDSGSGGGWLDGLKSSAKKFGDAVKNGDLGGALNAAVEGVGKIVAPGLYTKNPPDFVGPVQGGGDSGYLPYIPPQGIGGGAPTKDGKFDVIVSGGVAGQKGGTVIFIPPTKEPSPSPVPPPTSICGGGTGCTPLPVIPPIELPSRPTPQPIDIPSTGVDRPFQKVGPDILPPQAEGAPPKYEPNFDFSDPFIFKDPGTWCK